MNQSKVKIKFSGVPASMLGCLWGRAQLSKEYRSLFYDEKAIELVEKIEIDYDFSASDMPFKDIWFNISRKVNLSEFGPFSLRARQFDEKAKAYIAEHPHASVINIAAGLDTTFYRVDNGSIHWYDLDLPAIIDIRTQLLPEPDRVTYIAKSLLDPSWCKNVTYTKDGVFTIAGGVLHSLGESQVKQFFSMLADNFPDSEIVFNAMSRSEEGFRTWMDIFPPEQRNAMQAALVEVLKDWWEKAPQDQRDKVSDMIAALKTSTKPNGKEWADLESWWNQLSDKEKEGIMNQLSDKEKGGVMRNLMTAFRGGVGMWTIEDVSEFTKWDSRITVIDQFPMFKNILRDSLSAEMRRLMDYSDETGGSSIIHLRV